MQQRVFVFGTLKEGFPNFLSNQGTRVPGTFTTQERFPLYLIGQRYSPWLMDVPGEGHRVLGQVFEVDPAALDAMDQLERITEPDGYRRVLLEVARSDGDQPASLHVNVYIKPPECLDPAEIRLGPLAQYTHEHAALYRPRA